MTHHIAPSLQMATRQKVFGAHGRPPRNHGYRPPRPPESTRLFLPYHHLLLLFILSIVTLVSGQLNTPSLPFTTTLPPLNSSNPVLDLMFPSSPSLFLTLSICSLNSNASQIPNVLVSTASPPDYELDDRTVSDRSSGGTGDANRRLRGGGLWSLSWDMGFANWTYTDDDPLQSPVGMRIGFEDGQSIASGNVVIQLAASSDAPLSSIGSSSLYLGDTTSNQVLLFSPLLLAAPQAQPTYPNYTLPPAQMDLPPLPEFSLPSFDLIVVPTGSSPTSQALDQSLCAIRNANTTTGALAQGRNMVVNATTGWSSIGGQEGYRTHWVVGGLLPGTNYTAWFVQGDTNPVLSQPIWFTTKQSSFPCQLVLPNAYCPSIGYAAPLAPNTTSILASPAPLDTLPETITDILTPSLQSFASSLLTKACGRDFYSHVSSCLDCHTAYRDWVCRTLIPRCADPSAAASLPPDIIPPRTVSRPPAGTGAGAGAGDDDGGSVVPAPYAYDELLPCLGVCNAVDRTCPAFMLFACPQRGVNANETYGFFGQDDAEGDGSASSGSVARSSDQWGNRWCNGP